MIMRIITAAIQAANKHEEAANNSNNNHNDGVDGVSCGGKKKTGLISWEAVF